MRTSDGGGELGGDRGRGGGEEDNERGDVGEASRDGEWAEMVVGRRDGLPRGEGDWAVCEIRRLGGDNGDSGTAAGGDNEAYARGAHAVSGEADGGDVKELAAIALTVGMTTEADISRGADGNIVATRVTK